ncbi:hypothetical protein J2Z48_001573 [Croceifilum oryzae]|uniref:Uncharacterized protein n=1 Tax=Croceifilum oryzae TaxID=1553429 RepID=A0AAJ1WS80_9BACL|nr:hypothetical protein [Croceifilum oryzae]
MDVPKKLDYRREVEAMLRSYPWLLRAVEEANQNELPSTTSHYGGWNSGI